MIFQKPQIWKFIFYFELILKDENHFKFDNFCSKITKQQRYTQLHQGFSSGTKNGKGEGEEGGMG